MPEPEIILRVKEMVAELENMIIFADEHGDDLFAIRLAEARHILIESYKPFSK